MYSKISTTDASPLMRTHHEAVGLASDAETVGVGEVEGVRRPLGEEDSSEGVSAGRTGHVASVLVQRDLAVRAE